MITYPQFHLASAPLTGASWIVLAMEELGHPHANTDSVVDQFKPCLPCCTRVKLSLARHPCDWLWNFYCVGIQVFPEEMGVFALLRQLDRCQPFEHFVAQYLQQCPGMIGRWVFSYKADTFQRFEDQPHAFTELMSSLTDHPVKIQTVPRLRLPSMPSWMWRPGLKRELMEAERPYVEHFDYW